ncbi:MAG: methyltransferase family protein [Candidatus Hodarchaeales archaeon]|jgi:protein-S-isoprenylcysteine O-methyltransferase Ste14
MKVIDKSRTVVFNITGYLILLVQQLPSLGAWVPLMAAPVALFLTALVSNIPVGISEAFKFFIEIFLPFPLLLLGRILIILSLVIVVYSIVYLGVNKRKKKGLVTSGPYRFIRHPQYTGFLLLTIGFTGWSYFLVKNTFGISWISAEDMIVLWFLELLAYIILALVEEMYLLKEFGTEYATYKTKTSFFIPLPKVGRFDIVVSIFVFSLLLFGVILVPL